MPELWAHCEPCSRWFFVPFRSNEELAQMHCPVCADTADRFEVRLEQSTFPVELLSDATQLT